MSPLNLALAYIANGWPVFPCRAQTIETYDHETGEVTELKVKTPYTSNGFKSATKVERIVRRWWQDHPDAMVGVPTGAPISAWVLDIDRKILPDGNVINGYETLAALEEEHGALPDTRRVLTPSGGTHYFFRHVPGVRNRGAVGVGIDVRGDGGYVIAGGSVMTSGARYEWVDEDAPILDAPDWLLKLVLPPTTPATAQEATRAAYVHAPSDNSAYVERAVADELDTLASKPQGGRGEAVNRSAFSLGTLVGAGVLSRSEAEAALFEAASACGVVAKDGAREIKAKIRRGLDAGIRSPRVIPESTRMEDNTRPIDVSGIAAQPARRAQASALAATADEDLEPTPYKLTAVDDLEALTYPGGLVQDLIDWIASSAEQPNRALAMAAVLPLVGALAGSRYSTGSRDTRPNIYTVALAESGFGKEHARSQIKRILMADQGVFNDYSGPARIMSASALREVLERSSSVNCQIDEFGGFVREITDRKAGSHQRAISTDLRDYYSASSTFFEGAAYRGTPPKRIYNPCLCIHGTSTPEQFWSALSSASAEDGLLPRLILFNVTGEKPEPVRPTRDIRDVPYVLMERLAAVAGVDVAKKRAGNLRAGRIRVAELITAEAPHVVPWDQEAIVTLQAVKATIAEKGTQVLTDSRPFVRRIVENAIKLALIVAVGIDPKNPVITEAVFEWAASVAWTCAAAMIAEVDDRLADNQREANFKRIATLIRAAGAKGITEGRLADRCKAIDGWQREEILKDLRASGKVELAANDNIRGRPKRRLVWAL